ncbi:hypothetical protein V6N12_047335 [Hibiscus sabdariffa]|uniref:Uncharacterized protein n=1 Tax=Hibiscus sabdariffa TaxID=183260 RepID=A0ABR2DAK7_9ROSI
MDYNSRSHKLSNLNKTGLLSAETYTPSRLCVLGLGIGSANRFGPGFGAFLVQCLLEEYADLIALPVVFSLPAEVGASAEQTRGIQYTNLTMKPKEPEENFNKGFVNTPTRMMLDASANGTLLDKPPREGLEILEKLAQNDYQHPTTCRGNMRRGTTQLDSSDTILAQISALTNMVNIMQRQLNTQEVKAVDAFCELCGNNHDASECG